MSCEVTILCSARAIHAIPRRVLQKKWVGVCCTPPETLTLFQTKICDLPYPISDLDLPYNQFPRSDQC